MAAAHDLHVVELAESVITVKGHEDDLRELTLEGAIPECDRDHSIGKSCAPKPSRRWRNGPL